YSDADLRRVLADIERLTLDYQRDARQLDAILAAGHGVSEEERQAYARIGAVEARALPVIERVIGLREAGNHQEIRRLLVGEAGSLFTDWLDSINAFIDMQEERSYIAASRALSVASSFQMQMIALCIVALLIGAFQSWLITRGLIK